MPDVSSLVPGCPGMREIPLSEALPSLFLLVDGNILEFTLKRGAELWVLELAEEDHTGSAAIVPAGEISLTVDRFRRDV